MLTLASASQMSFGARGQTGSDCSAGEREGGRGFYFVQLFCCHLVSDVSGRRSAALNYECCELADMIECIDAISPRVTKELHHADN